MAFGSARIGIGLAPVLATALLPGAGRGAAKPDIAADRPLLSAHQPAQQGRFLVIGATILTDTGGQITDAAGLAMRWHRYRLETSARPIMQTIRGIAQPKNARATALRDRNLPADIKPANGDPK